VKTKRRLPIWQKHCNLCDSANAVKCLTKLIELNPHNSVNFNGRANYYVEGKQYGKAISDLTQVLKLRPGEFEPFIMRADVYQEMKQYQKAIADYSRAIEMNKFRAGRAYKGRAECYKALGNSVAAERDLKQSNGGEAVYR
jgi:tetratricopeptide (TPR) repeat protein